jgi:hypothetical protein
MRKAFTVSERTAIADAIAEKLAGRHGGKRDQEGNISHLDSGRTRDIAVLDAKG